MSPQMHDKIMQAKSSHSKIYFDQRTDPHYLVPERPTEFAFERANPSDKRLLLLQRHATYAAIRELLDETRDINQLKTNIHEHDQKDQIFSKATISPRIRAITRHKAHLNCTKFKKAPQEKTQQSVRTIVSCTLDTKSTHPKFNGRT
jgi:hypothetical protein